LGLSRLEEIVNQYYRGELSVTQPLAVQAPSGIAEELAKLHSLRQQGALSEDEFQKAKAKVMS